MINPVNATLPHPAARKKAFKQIGKLCRQAVRKAGKFKNHLGAAYRVSALYEWAAGRPRAAFRSFERSIEASRDLGAQYELAATYLDLGRFLMESGEPNAGDYLDLAHRLFDACGAELDRARAGELRTQLAGQAQSNGRLPGGPHGLAAAAADQRRL